MLAERWGTRIFDAETPIDEAALASALRPPAGRRRRTTRSRWRFVVARRGTAEQAQIVDALMGFNQAWAADAAALIVFAASASLDGKPLPWAAYDTGQAAAHFTVQAHASGLYTHQMGGFDRDRIAQAFGFGDDLAAVTVMAVGALGDIDAAPEALREREQAPRTRRPIEESLVVDA